VSSHQNLATLGKSNKNVGKDKGKEPSSKIAKRSKKQVSQQQS
jgi:hypothetical protein